MLAQRKYLLNNINELALNRGKMAFLTGPRQVGKTTLAKSLLDNKSDRYFNWDDLDFRRLWTKSPKQAVLGLNDKSYVIFDELHKAAKWKQNLKGLYDTLETKIKILVTGSARLDIYKKGSDSLMGRYLNFRLHPFSLGELLSEHNFSPNDLLKNLTDIHFCKNDKTTQDYWQNLTQLGGFPEPLFSSSKKILNIWQKSRIEKIVRQDLRDLSKLPELSKIEMLISLLPERAANPLSITSLREDLEVSYDSVLRWLNYLKSLYYLYEIKPYSTNIVRGLKKEGKLYLWDWSEITDLAARYENMIGSHLLKACHYWTDAGEGDFALHYLKTKEKKEIDFLITLNRTPFLAIECKLSDENPSANFSLFRRFLPETTFIQLVNKPNVFHKIKEGNITICSATLFLKFLP